ncbi:MAG: PAS-domain containing protein [Marinobacterium sp.]|nr:PAS-domain containing protein [Marinobacterium sp.]
MSELSESLLSESTLAEPQPAESLMADALDEAGLEQQVLTLKAENERLKRINRVLIERIETGPAGKSYGAFEQSVALADQVWQRTGALNQALSDLRISHQALRRANEQTALFQQLLMDAIDSISDAFVLFDEQYRIMLFNQPFAELWRGCSVEISIGLRIENLELLARERGLLQERLLDDNNIRIYRLSEDRWVQVRERSTSNGGRVVLYTDITRLKRLEARRREEALAEKSRLLQAAVDNLDQGIVLCGPDNRVVLWNQRFAELTGISAELLAQQCRFESLFCENCATGLQLLQQGTVPDFTTDCHGRMLEIRSHATPDGGFVATCLDITERHHHAETLREQARWIRMVTDNLPAMIAYVDSRLHFSFTNRQYSRFYGCKGEDARGRSIHQVLGVEQVHKLLPWIDRALDGETVSFELEERDASNQSCYILRSYVPDLDTSGKPVGIFILAWDTTERRRSAEALEEAYQTMEQRVHERTSELVALNGQLRNEVDDRTRAEALAREARQEAEQANLSKTKFLAAVSHDLLQPLNAARLFISALGDRVELHASSRKMVGSAATALADVESLISTLIDISKLDAGTVRPDVGSFPLSELLDSIAHEFSQIAQTEGVRFRYRGSGQVVRSDSQLLARMVRNLLSNAIRYAPAGTVLLACRQRMGAVEIQIWDTGTGIPEAQLNTIFQEFKRLPSECRRDNSLGLGLAIVDKMSRILNHQITVRSEEGRGSMFSIRVPFGQLQVPVGTAVQPQMVGLERLSGASIWVIDNEQAICEGMATLLTGWGCDVVTARSAEHLQQQLDVRQAEVSLVIADYHLDDGHSGLELVDWISSQRESMAPVLMITANHSPELKEIIRLQGYQLMHKPVKPLKLKMALLHLLP